jgi:isoleucyl-tRNA synthetase
MSQKEKNDYSSTLQLPKTSFSMKANLLNAEPKHQARWAKLDLYREIQSAPHPSGSYTFHDGPPYANGPIHMGHLLNKILKDLVVRSRVMSGFEVRFVPGWDCHGLPIEHQVLKELGEKGKELGTLEVRRRCRDYADRFVSLQSQQLQRLGTLADYDHPYITMDPAYEGAVLEVFSSLVAEGLVYRDVKPVHWSIANQTALAEAELEYFDRTDTSIYVLFEVEDPAGLPSSLNLPRGETASLMIWTTTPWTLPANLAVALAPAAEYSLFSFDHSGTTRYTVVANELQRIFSLGEIIPEELGRCTGKELVESGTTYRHPFIDRTGVLVSADYVVLDEGTGLVHTAPGHGAEDYFTGIHENLPIYCPVLADGTFDNSVPDWLIGEDVWTANELVVESLRKSGHLFYDHRYEHSYPHDWRSKTPTIFRATEQWFVAVDRPYGEDQKSLRTRALEAARSKIRFVPEWGRSRLEGMLEARPDWCISRQRSWGLPIPAFTNPEGEILLTSASVRAVAGVVRRHGSDFWFESSAQELLADYELDSDPDAPPWLKKEGREALGSLERGQDIFDVWFEAGSSWNGVLRERKIGYPSDLYLEGSDQHRGWFQLSLLPGLGMTAQSPFQTVLTHGFMVDADGRKMSKSRGNAIEVADVLKKHGADICRWWVSSLNYTNDFKVDWEFFKVSSEEYRKVRNTVRFLLGNLRDFDPESDRYTMGEEDRYSIDAWALQKLDTFVKEVRSGYEDFKFKTVSETIFDFCNETMSSVYLAAVKDRLYCDAPDSKRRRRTQTVLYDVAYALIKSAAPILVHTSEEAWLSLMGQEFDSSDSVHLQLLPEPSGLRVDPAWDAVMGFRQSVLKKLEEAKSTEGGIKNPLDCGIRVSASEDLVQKLDPFRDELVDLCGVSRLEITSGESLIVEVVDLRDEPRCERSWKRDGTVRMRSDGGYLSDRDAGVLGLD